MIQISTNRKPSVDEEKYYENTQSNKQAHLKSSFKIDISQVFKVHKLFIESNIINQTRVEYCKQLS